MRFVYKGGIKKLDKFSNSAEKTNLNNKARFVIDPLRERERKRERDFFLPSNNFEKNHFFESVHFWFPRS